MRYSSLALLFISLQLSVSLASAQVPTPPTKTENPRSKERTLTSANSNEKPAVNSSPVGVPTQPVTSTSNESSIWSAWPTWASQHLDFIGVLIASLFTCLVTVSVAWFQNRNSQAVAIKHNTSTITTLNEQFRRSKEESDSLRKENESIKQKLKSTEEQLEARSNELEAVQTKLGTIREKLGTSRVIKTYEQPVLLIGPRNVGKTSLLLQWHSSWDRTEEIPATQRDKTSRVPILDIDDEYTEPHFADPEVQVRVKRHLVLKIHDFPGEPSLQRLIREFIIEETQRLKDVSKRNLGVVLILMFDAEEAYTGIKDTTQAYYNGELFKELRELVAAGQVHIEKLILVFNKYDELRKHIPLQVKNDRELMDFCLEKFATIYRLLWRACDRQRVCEIFTIVSRKEMRFKNRGAPIVMGEAARAFVAAFAGSEAAKKIFEQSSDTYAAERYWQ